MTIYHQFIDLRNSKSSFETSMRAILLNEWWRVVDFENTQPVKHKSFESYVNADTPQGLETSMKVIRALAEPFDDLTKLINKVTADVPGDVGEFGNGRSRNGNTIATSETNSTDRIRGRLTKDGHDDLRALVDAGELSANAAAIQVGYRKKKTTVSCVNPESAAKTLHRLCSDEFIFQLKQLL